MKKIFMSILKYATSKKLLWIVTGLFIIATVAMYVQNYFGIDITQLQETYNGIKDAFIWELVAYSGKATIEKTDLVKQKIDQVMNNM